MSAAVRTVKRDVCITALLVLLLQEKLVAEHFDVNLD